MTVLKLSIYLVAGLFALNVHAQYGAYTVPGAPPPVYTFQGPGLQTWTVVPMSPPGHPIQHFNVQRHGGHFQPLLPPPGYIPPATVVHPYSGQAVHPVQPYGWGQ